MKILGKKSLKMENFEKRVKNEYFEKKNGEN